MPARPFRNVAEAAGAFTLLYTSHIRGKQSRAIFWSSKVIQRRKEQAHE
jgi:hypothetical protein